MSGFSVDGIKSAINIDFDFELSNDVFLHVIRTSTTFPLCPQDATRTTEKDVLIPEKYIFTRKTHTNVRVAR